MKTWRVPCLTFAWDFKAEDDGGDVDCDGVRRWWCVEEVDVPDWSLTFKTSVGLAMALETAPAVTAQRKLVAGVSLAAPTRSWKETQSSQDIKLLNLTSRYHRLSPMRLRRNRLLLASVGYLMLSLVYGLHSFVSRLVKFTQWFVPESCGRKVKGWAQKWVA